MQTNLEITGRSAAEGELGMLDPDQYDDVAARFDRYTERTTGPITECLMEMTRIGPGQQVLDVACGSGVVTRRVAAAVGPTGKAVGIDLSPGQIDVAASRAQSKGCSWSEFIVMDALHLKFADATFDAVVAQYPHLPDRRLCLEQMVRVLKSGGYLAICNGGGGAPAWPLTNAPIDAPVALDTIVDGLFTTCLETHFPHVLKRAAGAAPEAQATPGAQRDPQFALRDDLERAGLNNITLWSYTHVSPFCSAAEAFEWESIRNSLYRMHQASLEPSSVAAFRQDYLQKAQEKLTRWGVLGVSSGALFGAASKSN